MIEVPASVVSGSLKVGLQVVTAYKRPVLEIYHQIRNRFGSEFEYEIPKGVDGIEKVKQKTRSQNIFVQFTLVNIGSVRAENISLAIDGDLKRRHGDDFGGAFLHTIPQFAPGQMQHLFSFDEPDLLQYPDGGGKATGIKAQSFTITISYDSPKGLMNWVLGIPARWRGRKRFSSSYTFSPQFIAGDLPPPEYV